MTRNICDQPKLVSHLVTCAAFVFFIAASVTPILAADPIRGTSTDDWRGFGVLSAGKGYASSPLGQVHYRDVGPRDYETPIVLLHQSPMSMIQFADIQNAFVGMGIRAITVDTPGYGMSDMPPKQPTIREYADNLVYVLDHLKVDKVVIAGHHTGAQIAASFAANHPARAVAIIMHRAAQLTKEEAQRYLDSPSRPRTPLPDGSHFSRRFQNTSPTERQAILDAQTWLTITSYIQGPDIGHWAAFHYDMLPDLEKIKMPGLILSDVQDSIHEMDKRVAAMMPNFKYVEFSKGNLLEFIAEPERWAKIAAEFMADIEKERRSAQLER